MMQLQRCSRQDNVGAPPAVTTAHANRLDDLLEAAVRGARSGQRVGQTILALITQFLSLWKGEA